MRATGKPPDKKAGRREEEESGNKKHSSSEAAYKLLKGSGRSVIKEIDNAINNKDIKI